MSVGENIKNVPDNRTNSPKPTLPVPLPVCMIEIEHGRYIKMGIGDNRRGDWQEVVCR